MGHPSYLLKLNLAHRIHLRYTIPRFNHDTTLNGQAGSLIIDGFTVNPSKSVPTIVLPQMSCHGISDFEGRRNETLRC